MNAGTRQDQRLAQALRPGFFLPDDLTLAERVRLSLMQAANLAFVAPARLGGQWDESLLRDDAVTLADIAAFPCEREIQYFLKAESGGGQEKIAERVSRLLLRYDSWCRTLLFSNNEQVRRVGETMRAQIRQGLARLFGSFLYSRETLARGLQEAWQVSREGERFAPTEAQSGAERQLCRCAVGLLQAIDRVRPLAGKALELSLSDGRHDPAMGLLLSVLQLFQGSRAAINRFPERLTDFYYQEFLRLSRSPAQSEKACLVLVRDDRFAGDVVVEEGALFSGGRDENGNPINFSADQGVVVTDARIVDLRSVYLEHDPEISPEREFDYVTRVKMTTIGIPDGADSDKRPWYPLFGGKSSAASAATRDMGLGVAVASDLLLMQEGGREIQLCLQLSHPSDSNEALHTLLCSSTGERSPEWLESIFHHYQEYEDRMSPPRSGQNGKAGATVPEMARAVWNRSAHFESDVFLCFLLQRCLDSSCADQFRRRLGRLFAAWLAASAEELREADLSALRLRAKEIGIECTGEVGADSPLVLIRPHHSHGEEPGEAYLPSRQLIFERIFAGSWRALLSTTDGWYEHADVLASRVAAGSRCVRLDLSLRMSAGVPPVCACSEAVHGKQWPATAMLQLFLQAQTRLYGYGILRQWRLLGGELNVSVGGLRDIALYNQLGRLDPSKPFQPFGPLPTDGAYMIFGGAELMGKPLRSLRLKVKWGGLPRCVGGFAEHYAGYCGFGGGGRFRVGTAILMDGVWQGSGDDAQRMFDPEGDRRCIPDSACFEVSSGDLLRWHRSSRAKSREDAGRFDLASRNGFFRLNLEVGTGGFGHADYSRLLTAALASNSGKRKPRSPLPNLPYTPSIEHLSADYGASQKIALGRSAGDGGVGHSISRLYHLNGFGLQALDSAYVGDQPTVLADFAHDGNLYIGLEGDDLQGRLTLFFHLRKEEARESWHDARPSIEWSVWGGNGWHVLEHAAVLADATHGMLRSGVVSLNLPAGMERGCPQLPGQCYWMRLSVDSGFGSFAGLYGVYAHAVGVTRVQANALDAAPLAQVLPAGSIKQAQPTIPGLRAVLQPEPSFGGALPASPDTAVSPEHPERLRHKLRAVTSWDYERIVLDAFPEVFKVKCFPHQFPTSAVSHSADMAAAKSAPGHVLLVVVPAPERGQIRALTQAPKVDVARLEAIRGHLADRSPVGASVVVRNASYEHIQVRCCVQLVPGAHPGAAISKINRVIIEYLSPWHPEGLQAEFDWHVDAEMFEAIIRALPEVAAIDSLSLLHVVRGDDSFHLLQDTARQHEDRYGARRITPVQPWSLVLPTSRHLIELRGLDCCGQATATGISLLELGNTFIIGASSQYEGAHGE